MEVELKAGDTVRVPDSLPSNICHSDWFGKTGTVRRTIGSRIYFCVKDSGFEHHLVLDKHHIELVSRGEIKDDPDCAKCGQHKVFGCECNTSKIEQTPVCMCCTKTTYPEDVGVEVRHNDPCQFSSDERSMLPLAKSMFRNQMRIRAEKQAAETQHRTRIAESYFAENWMAASRREGKPISDRNIVRYQELFYHKDF